MAESVDIHDPGPDHFPVAVILERRPATSPWIDFVWQASGIAVGAHPPTAEPQTVREDEDLALFIVGGLKVQLFVDECESYYYNLVSDTPRAFVIAHVDEPGGRPMPFRVSMSFDEAHAYLEGEDEIYAVEVPAALYRWTEAFVIANYFPEKKRKRKLNDWKADTQPGNAGE
ncbi:MAG: DUF3305 domain-containing protein [Gammaproteobacteria bacterium]|nr:DUF3305 domain-containing protein [Gammaproteobacteria bacterium]MCP5299391.1 DUF3305 domain-containing protein [Chromatiaceae bacterium]